jgi:hypothetical protein
MTRKPVNAELIGGKSPRQRVWEIIRKRRAGFTQDDLKKESKVQDTIVRDYVRSLLNGGFISAVSVETVNALCGRKTYQLVRDNGVEAPRVTRKGEEVVAGKANEAMWGTLRRMFKTDAVDYRQLAAFASTTSTPISEATAKTYVLLLAAAGYLVCVQPASRGQNAKPARYRLLPQMDSGRRAPMIQRTKVVFDPNWNKVVWTEDVEATDE